MENKSEKILEVERQLDELWKQAKELMVKKISNAYNVAPGSFREVGKDNFLLAKAIFDDMCVERPCRALAYKKEFDNIQKMI